MYGELHLYGERAKYLLLQRASSMFGHVILQVMPGPERLQLN